MKKNSLDHSYIFKPFGKACVVLIMALRIKLQYNVAI